MSASQRHIDRMLQQLQPGRPPDEILSPHHQVSWLFDLATEPKLLDMIERQVGPDIVLWSSHLICKAPGTGRAVPWHQDAPYWNISGTTAGAIWIAFDDIDATNGGMAIVPQWHTKGPLKLNDNRQEAFFKQEIDPNVLPQDIDSIKVQYEMPAGGMATHHTMIPHNSGPNLSDRWRRVLVLRYIAADGELGPRMYPDCRTGNKFPREGFLVRGQDIANRGLRHSPFD